SIRTREGHSLRDINAKMNIATVFQRVETAFFPGRHSSEVEAARLSDGVRFPYGPFRFKARLSRGTSYSILASNDLMNWHDIASGVAKNDDGVEYVDSDASKFSQRF